jgi:hypothetical protein
MEYSAIEERVTSLSIAQNGTGFVDSLPEQKKWELYEMFKQQIQHVHPDEYEEAIYTASQILDL